MAILGENRYGKAEVRMVRVDRSREPHTLADWNVSVSLAGDMREVHLSGANDRVLPTDTQKNTVYALARQLGAVEPEAFALALARHFVDRQAGISRARVQVESYGWTAVGPHSLVRSGGEVRTVTVLHDEQSGSWVVGGLHELTLLNTTDSEFWGFARDEYTTLAETTDRILATSVEARWRFRTADVRLGGAFRGPGRRWWTPSRAPTATRCSRPCTRWAAGCWPRFPSSARSGWRCRTSTTSWST